MADITLNDYPAHLGSKLLFVVDHSGPVSYTTGGEVIGTANAQTGIAIKGLGSIDGVVKYGDLSVSGNYQIATQPTGMGSRKTWLLIWEYSDTSDFVGVTDAEVVLGTTPTNGTYTITATTGVGQIQIVVAGGVLGSVKVLNPGAYTSAPTFTPAAGLGSGATITAVIGNLGGYQVAAGANLSAETVRIGYLGR